MKLQKCANGHFYDGDKYSSCPHCSANSDFGGGVTVPVSNAPDFSSFGSPDYDTFTSATVPTSKNGIKIGFDMEDVSEVTIPIDIPTADDSDDEGKTIGINLISPENTADAGDRNQKPYCVGWLVCIKGKLQGKDFRLCAGKNTIGRSERNNVALVGDERVSRDNQAIVVYDPKSGKYYAVPGAASSLCYLNGSVLLAQAELKKNDLLELGASVLMFVPLCDDSFNWSKLGG